MVQMSVMRKFNVGDNHISDLEEVFCELSPKEGEGLQKFLAIKG